jgi:hypothetical protein
MKYTFNIFITKISFWLAFFVRTMQEDPTCIIRKKKVQYQHINGTQQLKTNTTSTYETMTTNRLNIMTDIMQNNVLHQMTRYSLSSFFNREKIKETKEKNP